MNDTDSEDEGVGEEEVDDGNNSIDPILIDEDDDGTENGDNTENSGDNDIDSDKSSEHSTGRGGVSKGDATVDSEDVEDQQHKEVDSDEEEEQQPEEIPPAQRLRAVQELDSDLDGVHWGNGMVGSSIHKYVVGSVI